MVADRSLASGSIVDGRASPLPGLRAARCVPRRPLAEYERAAVVTHLAECSLCRAVALTVVEFREVQTLDEIWRTDVDRDEEPRAVTRVGRWTSEKARAPALAFQWSERSQRPRRRSISFPPGRCSAGREPGQCRSGAAAHARAALRRVFVRAIRPSSGDDKRRPTHRRGQPRSRELRHRLCGPRASRCWCRGVARW